MKRTLALILALLIALTCVAFAEVPDVKALTDAELEQLIKDARTELDARKAKPAEKTDAEPAGEPEEIPADIELKKGMKKDPDVKKMQQRLIDLKYLNDKADGSFGGKSEAALKIFQKAVGLTATGVADAETLRKLYADDAPEAKVYNKLNFKEISRDPEAYKGENYTFTGKVLQVLEGSDYGGTTSTSLRIATKGNYDNVVYVNYERPNSDKRILEDDKVTVYGECDGLYTYETIMGGTVTLPKFTAETISFN